MPLSGYNARLPRKITLELLNELLMIQCDGEYDERGREEADEVFDLHRENRLFLAQMKRQL